MNDTKDMAASKLESFRMEQTMAIMNRTNLMELVFLIRQWLRSLYPDFPIYFFGLVEFVGPINSLERRVCMRFYSDHSADDKLIFYFKDVFVLINESGYVTKCEEPSSRQFVYLARDVSGIGQFQLSE